MSTCSGAVDVPFGYGLLFKHNFPAEITLQYWLLLCRHIGVNVLLLSFPFTMVLFLIGKPSYRLSF